MRRAVLTIAAGTAVTVLLLAAGAGATLEATAAVLSRPIPPGVEGGIVSLAGGGARLTAPAGTPLLAVLDATVAAPRAPADLRLSGRGDDAGLAVDIQGVTGAPAPGTSVGRGDPVGSVGPAPSTPSATPGGGSAAPPATGAEGVTAVVTITATLDGRPLDLAPLLDAALHGGGAAIAGAFQRPVDGATVTQWFGCTSLTIEPVDVLCPSHHFHSGVDLAAPAGTPVRAALPGTAHVLVSATGYGLHVVVDAGGGLQTLYGHLSTVDVVDGEPVDAGQTLGGVGSSGNSTGPHLHFEVRRDGVPEDPAADVTLP